jgi:hypothetical protein
MKALDSALGRSAEILPFMPDAGLVLEKGMESAFDAFFPQRPPCNEKAPASGLAGRATHTSQKDAPQKQAPGEDLQVFEAARTMAQALFALFGEICLDMAQTGLDTGWGFRDGLPAPPFSVDPVRLSALGFETFAQNAVELVDADRTLGPGGAAGIYEHLAAFFLSSSSRVPASELAAMPLHFADAKSWLAFCSAFGHGSIMRAGVERLFFSAKAAALAQAAGPLPVQAFEQAAASLENPAASPTQARSKALSALPENAFSPVCSSAGILARVRAHKALAGMGPFGAIVAKASWLKAIKEKGKNRDSGPADLLKAARGAARGFSSQDKPRFWLCLQTAIDEVMEFHPGLWHAADALPGDLSAILDCSCRIIGPFAWTRTLSAACARALCADAAFCLVHKGGLDNDTQSALAMCGMEGSALQSLAGRVSREADSRDYLLPENLAVAPAAALRTFLLAGAGLLADDEKQGPRPSPAGAAMKILLEIPDAPWGENAVKAHEPGSPIPGPGGLARFLATLPLLGWLKTCAQSLARGIEPPDPADGRTWTRAAALSGATGLYADWLFDRLKNLETGPESAQALLETGRAMAAGSPKGIKAFADAIMQTPFVNLRFARMALDVGIALQ